MSKNFSKIFNTAKPIIGMVHLNGFTPEKVQELAKREIEIMYSNGIDAVLVENYYGTAQDVAWALSWLHEHYTKNVYGVNILGHTELAFELAEEYGAAFIQIDSVCGHLCKKDDEVFARKLAEARVSSPAFLIGGVRFKYQPVKSGRSIREDLLLGTERCDAIVVTGSGTGESTDIEKIKLFRETLGDFPLIVGAGLTDENCREQLSIADGAIIGTWIKHDGETSSPIDARRVKQLIQIVQEVRAY